MAGAFRAGVEAKDLAAMSAALREDVVFRSPVAHSTYEGRETVTVVLGAVLRVLEDFRYERDIASGADQVLEFKARVGDREVHGVDVLRLDEDGQVEELVVMIRPLSALNAVAEAMAAQLRG